jgi:MFS family permease
MVFFWLLWGDFTMILMEDMLPKILPLQLEKLGASNMVLSIFIVTVPSAMNFLVNPVVSFRSDRHRGRWGRRIPFLLLPTPFIAGTLVAIAFAPEIGSWVHGLISVYGRIAQTTAIIGTIGVLLVMFQFFNMFISSTYYYLFNDVVPPAYFSRFLGAFRVVGALAVMTFNYFLFPYAQTHTRAIFLGTAALYFIGFTSMCFGLKEGQYPPPPPLSGDRKGVWAGIQTYFRECFTHSHYLTIFAFGSIWQLTGACGFVSTLFYLHLGISLGQLGKFYTLIGIPGLFLMIPLGILCDRVHPIRVIMWAILAMPVLTVVSFFVIHDFRSLVIVQLLGWPVSQCLAAAITPLLYNLLPRERFGQFGSADAMMKSITLIFGSVTAGFFMDLMKKYYHGNQEYYRFMYVWTVFFQLIACFLAWRVYAGWKEQGGLHNYKAPAAPAAPAA